MWTITYPLLLFTVFGRIGCSSFEGHVAYQGCYDDHRLDRRTGHLLHPFLASDCFKVCSGNGYQHAGLNEINDLCYCGEDILSTIDRADSSRCLACKEESNIFCGGVQKYPSSFISVYEIEAHVISDNGINEVDSMFDAEPLILLAGHGGVYSYNISSQKLATVINVNSSHIEGLDYDLQKKEAFAIWDDTIHRFPLLKQDAPLHELDADYVAILDYCLTFAVDWVHGLVYYPNCYSHEIEFRDIKSDSYSKTLVKNLPEGAWALDMAIDPYKGLLFWTTGAALWSCRVDGRDITKVVAQFPVNKVSSISLDLAAARVYFSGPDKHDKNTSRLYFTSYSGALSHSLQFHEYDGGTRILSFGIFDYHIYYIKHVEGNSSAVMSSKIDYNNRPTEYLKGQYIEVDRLRLVHPRLQAPATVDVCTYHGCSHLCVLEDSKPKCLCPRLHHLQQDQKICEAFEREHDYMLTVLRICFGLGLVLAVLLGAGVLMCLSDKLWSQLHPAVVALSVPGPAKRTFMGQRRPDGENLI